MPKISVTIITLNEEKNIAKCLTSLSKIADDIVIVDSFSTDRTEEIATGFPLVRFFKQQFLGYVKQKNYAISLAIYPHILSIDADEVVSDELQESILNVKKNWQADGYSFNRLTNYCGQWIHFSGWYPDFCLRLWDSRLGKFDGINLHEKFVLQTGTTQKHLNGDLLHYSFYDVIQHTDQIKKFADIKSKQLFELGKKTNLFKILFYPPFKFFRHYFLKFGVLDGFAGFVIAVQSAHYAFLTYLALWYLQNSKDK